MAETMSQVPHPAPASSEGLYFQIVCDPGHERTARELSELPKESRERVWADMTGGTTTIGDAISQDSPVNVASNISLDATPTSEDSDLVGDRLNRMEVELKNLPATEALTMALQTPLGQDHDFRAAFLRAEDFDGLRAARRFQRHFDQKLALFDPTKMGDYIRLPDLSDDDLESLQCGGLQFLPKTDRGGRLVFVSRYRHFKYKNRDNMLRALWYQLMSALDTPNVSNVGLVIIGYEIGDFVPVDYELTRQMFRLVRNLPIRVLASHSCYSASPMQKVADLVVHMVSNFARLRLRLHYGSHQECRYRLMTMGIPVDYLPISMDGVLHVENHQHWVQFRVQQERAQGHHLPPAPTAPMGVVQVANDEVEDDTMEL